MLSDICCDDRIPLCKLVDFLDSCRTVQCVKAVHVRILLLEVFDLRHPRLVGLGCKLAVEYLQDFLCIADYTGICWDILIYLSRIYIYMYDLCIWRELGCISDNSV